MEYNIQKSWVLYRRINDSNTLQHNLQYNLLFEKWFKRDFILMHTNAL